VRREVALANPRTARFHYRTLPSVGKLSLYLSTRLIVKNLRHGNWLDILSGYRAHIQMTQRDHPRVTEFHALDHALDPGLRDAGFQLHETHIDTALPFEDGTFDNVTIVNGLEHLWHAQQILSESHRILRDGGVLQVVVPTWFGKPFLEFLAFRLKNPQAYIEMNDHKMYYDEKTLWPMLVRAGFEPKDVWIARTKLFCSLYAKGVKSEPAHEAVGS